MAQTESDKRHGLALEAIKKAYGTESGEDNVNLFVEHHIEELSPSYWQEHLETETPEGSAVVNLLQLGSSWGDDDMEYFDFTLPGDVTNYVVSVHFDVSGNIDAISMDS